MEISRISPGEWHRVVNQKLPLMFKDIGGYRSTQRRREIVARWIRQLILQSPYSYETAKRIIQDASAVAQFEAGHPLTILIDYDRQFRINIKVKL